MNGIRKCCLLTAILTLTAFGECERAAAQPPDKTLHAPDQKLPKTQGSTRHDSIRCGLQDHAGNLWFGSTGEGVYRYDKKGFTQFTTQDGLDSDKVWSMIEDKKGRIWFGTDSGLSRWDGKTIRRIPISSASELPGTFLPSSSQTPSAKLSVWSLLEDTKGTIWVGTDRGVYCGKDEAFTPFLNNFKVLNALGLHLKMVESILEDRQGNIWFSSGMPPGMEGLCRFDGIALTRFEPGGEKWIRTVIEGRDGILWLGTRNKGAWRYDGQEFSRFTDQPGIGLPRLVDRSGNIWFGGEGRGNGLKIDTGIWRYDGKTFKNFSTKEGFGKLEDWREVWCIVEDREGNIWVGTRNTGLYRYDGKSFVCFSDTSESPVPRPE